MSKLNNEKALCNQYQTLAFSEGIPTAFFIESPLQVLCVKEAIAEFKITDYIVVLVLERDNVRNTQTLKMVEEFNMPHQIRYREDNPISKNLHYTSLQSDILRKYDRVMVGEYMDFCMLSLCGQYASNHSVLVYFDDGVESIPILENHKISQAPYKVFLKKMLGKKYGEDVLRERISNHWKMVGLYDGNFYYTIYADIDSPKFIIYKNSMSHLRVLKPKPEEIVLVIGTFVLSYEPAWGIYLQEFEHILGKKLLEVRRKYPTQHIVYIPHGRDTNPMIPKICDSLDIEYRRIPSAVEYYVLKNSLNVKAVYGFNSSALLTLKLLTNAVATSWCIVNSFVTYNYNNKEIARYYASHEIKIDYIPTGVLFITRLFRYLKNKFR